MPFITPPVTGPETDPAYIERVDATPENECVLQRHKGDECIKPKHRAKFFRYFNEFRSKVRGNQRTIRPTCDGCPYSDRTNIISRLGPSDNFPGGDRAVSNKDRVKLRKHPRR